MFFALSSLFCYFRWFVVGLLFPLSHQKQTKERSSTKTTPISPLNHGIAMWEKVNLVLMLKGREGADSAGHGGGEIREAVEC